MQSRAGGGDIFDVHGRGILGVAPGERVKIDGHRQPIGQGRRRALIGLRAFVEEHKADAARQAQAEAVPL